ncbi:MAG TPA: energy transducer TonB [Lacunisphaera sp.]|nr:energy transducer TonB [Lacunisphaera sp.]
MKTLLRSVLPLVVASAAFAQGTFESIGVEVTVEPQLPATLMMTGLRDGRVVVAIDVDAEGKLADFLVLAASHRDLIRPCVSALQSWTYRPARYDGVPVLAQLQLSIDISQKGAVISRTPVESLSDMVERIGPRRSDYQVWSAREIDHQPVAIFTVPPRYAEDARKQGVKGRIKVHFYIDEKGAVRMPAVHADAEPYLSSVAIKALREWKFEPAMRRGKPVLVAATQEFAFGDEP